MNEQLSHRPHYRKTYILQCTHILVSGVELELCTVDFENIKIQQSCFISTYAQYNMFPALQRYYYVIVINVGRCKCLYYTILERIGDDPTS